MVIFIMSLVNIRFRTCQKTCPREIQKSRWAALWLGAVSLLADVHKTLLLLLTTFNFTLPVIVFLWLWSLLHYWFISRCCYSGGFNAVLTLQCFNESVHAALAQLSTSISPQLQEERRSSQVVVPFLKARANGWRHMHIKNTPRPWDTNIACEWTQVLLDARWHVLLFDSGIGSSSSMLCHALFCRHCLITSDCACYYASGAALSSQGSGVKHGWQLTKHVPSRGVWKTSLKQAFVFASCRQLGLHIGQEM